MKRFSATLVLLLVLMVSEPVLAADLAGFYVAPKFFWSYQDNGDMKSTTPAWNSGVPHTDGASDKGSDAWGGALAIGYDFKKAFALPIRAELEYAMRGQSKISSRAMDTSALGSTNGDYYDITRKLGISSLFANVFYDINTGTAFTPYVGGGIGFADIRVKDHTYEGYYGYTASGRKHVTNFAWNLTAGVAYAFDGNWSVDLGYRYCDFGQVKGAQAYDGGNVYHTAKSNVTAHEVMLGARYTF